MSGNEDYEEIGNLDEDELDRLVPKDFRNFAMDLEAFKDKYEKIRKNLEKNISYLGFEDVSYYIGYFLLERRVSTRHVLLFLNLCLKNSKLGDSSTQPLTTEQNEEILEDLLYCFHYLLRTGAPNLSKDKPAEDIFQSSVRLFTAQIYRTEMPEIEKRITLDFFSPYDDTVKELTGLKIMDIINIIFACNVCVMQRIDKYERTSVRENVYLIEIERLFNYLNSKSVIPGLTEDILIKFFEHFSCEFGTEKGSIDSLIDDTEFSDKIFIINNAKNKVLFFSFLNNYQKARKSLVKRFFKAYSQKRWSKFNNHIGKFAETFTQDLIEGIFKVKYHKGVYLDDQHEVDGVSIYKDILFLFECKKRELTEPSLRGAIPSMKNDVNRILNEALEQLSIRRTYIESNQLVEVFNSNQTNKVKLLDIERDKISKIYCFSITFEDLSIILAHNFFYSDLDIQFYDLYTLTLSIKDLKILSMILRTPCTFLNYLFLRNHLLYQDRAFTLYYEELDLLGLYIKEGLKKTHDQKVLAILDHTKEIREYVLKFAYTKGKRYLKASRRLMPVFTKYRRFLYLLHYIETLKVKYATEFCTSIMCLTENDIRDLNNFLVINNIDFSRVPPFNITIDRTDRILIIDDFDLSLIIVFNESRFTAKQDIVNLYVDHLRSRTNTLNNYILLIYESTSSIIKFELE